MAGSSLLPVNICKKCGLEKDGPRCKPCAKATSAAWREANPGRAAEIVAAWRKANPEVAKARALAYRQENADKQRQKTAAWRTANPERVKASVAAYRAANPEKIAVAQRAYRQGNKEKIKAVNAAYYAMTRAKALSAAAVNREANRERTRKAARAYYATNPEKCAADRKAWRLANPDKNRVYSQNRRARKAGGKLSPDLIKKLLSLQNGRCACCRRPLGKNYHLDHVVPLALGGANEDSNMQLLTNRCNVQKGAKHPVQFMQERGFLL